MEFIYSSSVIEYEREYWWWLFLCLEGIGIVVDPGINFIRNALSAGLSIKDIDIVILTHSHVDHTADFEGIVTLFHEINDPRYEKNLDPIQIRLFASISAMNKFTNLLSFSYEVFKEVIIMNPSSNYTLSDKIRIETTPCQHNDLFCKHQSSCVGLKFYRSGNKQPIIGLTRIPVIIPSLLQHSPI